MNVNVNDRHFNNDIVPMEIPFFRWLVLKYTGKVYVFHAKKGGWSGELSFYIVKCSDCKQYFLDYSQGYKEYFLCPLCDLPKLQVETISLERGGE